jgi:hypothetical protein
MLLIKCKLGYKIKKYFRLMISSFMNWFFLLNPPPFKSRKLGTPEIASESHQESAVMVYVLVLQK